MRVGTDDTVTVIVNHSEMGQGPYTSVPMLVAEELDADWAKVRFEAAPVAAVYNHTVYGIQMTGGSTSTWTEWERVRKAGATARAMLIAAAAVDWSVEPATCGTEPGHVVHAASGRRVAYGRLAEKAADLKPPENVKLKDPKDFRIIGRPTRRLDTPDKVNGKAVFGLDVQLPGHAGRPGRAAAGVRWQGQELQRRQGQGRARREARRADPARRRRRRRRLLAREEGARGPRDRLGRRAARRRSTAGRSSSSTPSWRRSPAWPSRKDGDAAGALREGRRRRSRPCMTCRTWPTQRWSRSTASPT